MNRFAVAGCLFIVGISVGWSLGTREMIRSQSAGKHLDIDRTRRLLTCDSSGCSIKLVRSQEELLNAAPPRISVTHAHNGLALRRAENRTLTSVADVPFQTILGGCFGADLPASVRSSRPGTSPAVIAVSAQEPWFR